MKISKEIERKIARRNELSEEIQQQEGIFVYRFGFKDHKQNKYK